MKHFFSKGFLCHYRLLAVCGLLLYSSLANSQQKTAVLILDSCYKTAREQYPLIKQRDLIEKSKSYTVSNASKGFLPQFSLYGQATYQSAVTEIDISIKGFTFPTFSKDQYKVYAELDQTIYDGGNIKYQKEAAAANAEIQNQSLEVDLYALRDRINQVYFGILLMDEQLKQNDLSQKDVKNSIDLYRANVDNGTAMVSGLEELQAELLLQEQNRLQLSASRKTYVTMLGQFMNRTLPDNISLQIPAQLLMPDGVKRPELILYDSRKKSYDVQDRILNAANRPRLSFFVQGGYGRPALNLFDNNFDTYYIGGLRFSWSLGGMYTLKGQRELLMVSRQTEDVQRETFLFNTKVSLTQQEEDIQKLKDLISKDNEIITKRISITASDKARMENGVITVNDFITQLDKEDQAKQNLLLHQVQLLLTQYTYQTISGN